MSPPASPQKKRIRTSAPPQSILTANLLPLAPNPVHIPEMLQAQISDTIEPLVFYGPDNLIETRQDGLNTMLDTSRSDQIRGNTFGEVMEEETTEQPQEVGNNGQGGSGGSTFQGYASKGNYSPAPTLEDAKSALDDLTTILKPPRKTGAGYKDPGLDLVLRKRLEEMEQFLWMYINPESGTYD
jgi:hypothetical protein